jgi:hypothetical protein
MTSIEKAKELIDKFTLPFSPNIEESKQCALIAVDEILKLLYPENWGLEMNIAIDELYYWRKVKQEIENN